MWGVDTGGTRPQRPGAVSNDEMLEAAARHPDVFIPFVMVDVWRDHAGADEAKRLIEQARAGSNFIPRQGLLRQRSAAVRALQVIAAAKLPALFHTGQTAVGQGAGAGGGVRLKYGNPIYLDDVAVDFPDMPIIMAHPSFPWQDEALAIALHKAQVYIDLSGWSPKYFPPLLVQYANTLLKNKVLFGSDHPMITVDRWMADFEGRGIPRRGAAAASSRTTPRSFWGLRRGRRRWPSKISGASPPRAQTKPRSSTPTSTPTPTPRCWQPSTGSSHGCAVLA